ncbi:MAG: uracil-DNA glycosylase, partial [Planctomycetes bacterium]|nr:uracil-DNA glycosylase [Planctomycetota bacterium]
MSGTHRPGASGPGLAGYSVFREALATGGCRLCALAGNRTRIVVDRGNPGARAMAIGEAPGVEEDRRGLAFVGRGGRLFDQLAREAAIEPDRDLLIANIVKCRPPDNRVPRPEEVAACLPYLRQQIELVQPVVIAFLGATALRTLCPAMARSAMRDLVGRLFADPEFP